MKQEEKYDSNKRTEIDAVSKALSSIYTGVFLIDLINDRYTIINATESIEAMLKGIVTAQQAINTAVKKTVFEDEVVNMLSFVNLTTLSERMSRGKILNTEYRGVISGWVRGSFIEAERGQNGDLEKVLYTYQVIDEEKRKELEHLRELKSSYALSKKENQESREKTAVLEAARQKLTSDLKYHSDFTKIIMEQLNCGVLVYTVPGRNLLEINREALRIFGWKDKEEAAASLMQGRGDVHLTNTVQEMELVKLRETEGSVKYQFTINSGQKGEKQVLGESKSLSGRYGGKLIISTLADVTSIQSLRADKIFLKNANAELQRARDAVQIILNSGAYFCAYAEDGEELISMRYTDALQQLSGYFGKDTAPDSWKAWRERVYPEDRDYVESSYYEALKDQTGHTNYDVTYRVMKKDGTLCWHRAAAYIIRRPDGTAEFSYGLVMDVNEQKKASDQLKGALRQAERANKAKTSFLARMSHDIRTPMNGIMGLLEINERHAEDTEFVSKNRKKAKIAANHLLSLINNVLQLSKLEDPEIELSHEPFNILELIEEIIVIVEQRASERGITVERNDDPGIFEKPYVFGSPLHVKQIFINILGNAIKYNKENGSIYCHATVKKDGENSILFKAEIRDTGIGMSEEFLQHLFEPFAREQEESEGGCEGTGLGLSIVKQLIDKMGGTINVESQPDVGTCFTVEIPFVLASEEMLEDEDAKNISGDITGTHILLVEDNELNMDVTEILLMDAGAKITKAVNGQQALHIFEENEPETFDAILMDVVMPVMNGYEATRRIRALERKDAKEIPIIAITANAFTEDVESAINAGMSGHLAKPLDIEKVKAAICEQIEKRGRHPAKNAENKNQNARQKNSQAKEDYALRKLFPEYVSLYHIELNSGKYDILRLSENTNARELVGGEMKKFANFDEYTKQYVSSFIMEKDKEEFLEWHLCKNMKKRLCDADKITYYYHSVSRQGEDRYYEAYAVKGKTDRDVFEIFLGYRNIDSILYKEREVQEKLQRALEETKLSNEIIFAIARTYQYISRIDIQADWFEEISNRDEEKLSFGKSGRVSVNNKEVCRKFIAQEYQEPFFAFTDISTLPERMENEETIMTEYRMKDGSWHKLRFIEKKRDENGRLTHVLCVIRSISDRKKREYTLLHQVAEAKKDAALKSRFLSNMSHDIRTPMNGIIGMIELANHYPDNLDIQKRCRDKIMESSKYLVSLVNDILDINKLESDDSVRQTITFDLTELLNRANTSKQIMAQEKNVDYVVDWEKADLKHICLTGNPIYLERLLTTVADNAVKFTNPGGSVHVWCAEKSATGNQVIYEFGCSDNGIGMSESFVEHAFDLFSQENESGRTQYEGAGLGLAIAKKIADRLGGTIKIKSKPGQGTTVIMTVPFEIGKLEQIERIDRKEVDEEVSLEGIRVLVAEDNELNMEIIKFMLENNGIYVEHAADGTEAVKMFEKAEPGYYDAVFMDIMMPNMNGLDATRKIRSMKKADAETIPIIAISANAFAEDIINSRISGMNSHLAKPLNETNLLKELRRTISFTD